MNNEITLRTSKGEYFPGETVSGAVYLRICRPTEGYGIVITFKGNELCQYNYECKGKKSLKKETNQVDFSDITLYSQKDCFQFGSYVFPFSFQLANEITGTTELSGENDQSSWNVEVSYWIKAWVKGSEAIQEILPVVIYQCQRQELEESHIGTATTASFDTSRFLFGNKVINITVKLVENYKPSGFNTQLRLIITNDSKINVTGFEIKLKRYLRFNFPSIDCDLNNMSPVMTLASDTVEVLPESEARIIKTLSGSADSVFIGIFSGGLDNIQVPLTKKTTSGETINLPPSADGKYFKNRYSLDVSVSFSNKHTQTLSLNIPGVLPRSNQQWASWKVADWLYGCETKLSNSLFSVAEHTLHTEAFSGLPGFQVL